jgi:hypothetical protein
MEADLERALVGGDLDAVEAWLRDGAEVDRPLGHGNTALCLAARHGQRPLVERLIGAGADLEARGTWIGRTVYTRGFTPLLLALEAGHADVARPLLDAGAGADAADETGTTALMMAARQLPELVPRLLAAGADPDATDEDGWTALRYATEYEMAEAVDSLLAGGANPGGRSPAELRAQAQGQDQDGYTLADARDLLREYEEGGAPPAGGLADRLTEELAILCAEESVVPTVGGFELEITGDGGALIHHRPLDDGASIFAEGALPEPDLRVSFSRTTLDRLEPGGDLYRGLEDASGGMTLRPGNLARLLRSPLTAAWSRRGGTFLCRLAQAPDAALVLRFAPTRSERACVLTFLQPPLVAWLRREIDLAALIEGATVGGPDHELAQELLRSVMEQNAD